LLDKFNEINDSNYRAFVQKIRKRIEEIQLEEDANILEKVKRKIENQDKIDVRLFTKDYKNEYTSWDINRKVSELILRRKLTDIQYRNLQSEIGIYNSCKQVISRKDIKRLKNKDGSTRYYVLINGEEYVDPCLKKLKFGRKFLSSRRYEIKEEAIANLKENKFKYNLIDPENIDSIGLNPFVYDDPTKIAITISSVIKGMYATQHSEIEEAYREDVALQAIENMAIILKEMYPRMNDGLLPNLEDMLKMFTNFDLVEKMCEILAHNEELAKKYSIQLAYFRKNFYKTGSGRDETEKYIYSAVTQLDSLLRLPGVKTILCNRHENINFDEMLSNGDLTFVCTRRGDLGMTTHKAFGLFFLLAMQNAVLRRPGNENNRVANFLYIDEFPDFLGKSTEALFTMYRKYKVGTIITAQNLSQLDTPNVKEHYRQTILSNCSNKIFTGNADIDELEWWSKELGEHREWKMSDSIDFNTMKYDSKHGSVTWKFVPNASPGKLQTLGKNFFAYKLKGDNGKPMAGVGRFKYLSSKYKEPQNIKKYDFNKYSNSDNSVSEDETQNKKFDFRHVDFKDDRNEFDPVQTDTSDSSYLFDNEDAIIVNLKKGNPNNDKK